VHEVVEPDDVRGRGDSRAVPPQQIRGSGRSDGRRGHDERQDEREGERGTTHLQASWGCGARGLIDYTAMARSGEPEPITA